MKPRTRARAIALQVLYETDIANNHLPGDVFKARLEEITAFRRTGRICTPDHLWRAAPHPGP
ncbi:MAG: hypothetical protein MZV63_06795 [Marinilabiliales bacterium]|nr:hypothetical protein [Marinilabiliales bacterium]